MSERFRQALVGAALSALVPGVGQLYVGARRRGVALLGKYGTTASGLAFVRQCKT
jgi:TM2 domain-containing membrane protein YozV